MLRQEYFLGSGGVFGLLTALVGESLPGSGPCVAVGNALMQGPVIYHMPQSLVNAIKERAEQGDAYMKQLELDLYRSALPVPHSCTSADLQEGLLGTSPYDPQSCM